MLYYALLCSVVGMIAGVLHMVGVTAVAVQISWVLYLIGRLQRRAGTAARRFAADGFRRGERND